MKMFKAVCILTFLSTGVLLADVQPASLFSHNMVFQRGMDVPVWGTATAGQKVTVTFAGQSVSAITPKTGKWHVSLVPMKANDKPREMTIQGANTVTVTNVVVGDVWLCSGQSNMAMPVQKCTNAEAEIKAARHPLIRDFKIRINPTMTVASDVEAVWSVCSPETVGGFSATAYFTARELQGVLKIPIGLITAASGGTLIESYTAAKYLKDDRWAKHEIEVRERRAVEYSEEEAIAEHKRKLAEWKLAAEKARVESKPLPRRPGRQLDPHKDKNYPGNLYRGNIAPIIPYAIKGVVWYQGESNAFMPDRAEYYRVQLKNLIDNWRSDWSRPSMPFYFVQLPNFKAPHDLPNKEEGGWPLCRESFLCVTRTVPDTGMAVTIDIGLEKDIHPKNKQDVGKRMGSTILNKTYGKKTPTSPLMVRSETEGNRVILHFDYAGSGLKAVGGKLESFAIAGADKSFFRANAVIETHDGKDVVVVSSPEVAEPASVRYAWALNPIRANLYSEEGFPASPFRTDTWAYGLKSTSGKHVTPR